MGKKRNTHRAAPDDPRLARIRSAVATVRDLARAVMLGYRTGLAVWGRGGIGKSWAVEAEARAMQVTLRRLASVSGRGLYDHLQAFPDDVTLIEDSEQLFSKDEAVTVLREALWAVEREDNTRTDGRVPLRTVHWMRHQTATEFEFAGGVIITTNSPPPQTPSVQAVLSRIHAREISVTPSEIDALARHLAQTAPPRIMTYQMEPTECAKILDKMIDFGGEGAICDMRVVREAYELYVQHQLGDAAVDWRDHVRALMSQRVPRRFDHPVDHSGAGRRENQGRGQALIREILAATSDPREQLKMWLAQSGLARSMFFIRKSEVLGLGG